MIKQIFEAIEGMFRAMIYLLILVMGLVITGLGAYAIVFLAFRVAEFLWIVFFKEPWI